VSTTSSFNIDGGIHEIPLPTVSGRLWLCGKHYVAPNVELVRERHAINKVVCLVLPRELHERYPDYMQWHRDNAGGAGLWFPIDDLSYPPLQECAEFVEGLVFDLGNATNLLVHCAAGIGRAGTTAVAICMLLGMSPDDALTHVRSHRPMAGPEAGAQDEFIQLLGWRNH
jgi:protein-tyrosine phosphatase